MKRKCLLAAGLASLALMAAPTWAQTFPDAYEFVPETMAQPEVSGVFNPMVLSTQDVGWDGSGSVTIPFNVNQRGTVWLAVYEKGSDETGARGPAGAWVRLEPQDLFVYISPGQAVEAGANSITWDGTDWEGNAVGAGDYEFDLIAFNNLEIPALAGPAGRGFGHEIIDTRSDPPEIWSQEYERDSPTVGHKAGDMIRGTLGTDYLANPNAWERWNYHTVLDFEGARTLGGAQVDDEDPDIWWTQHHSGEGAGLYKMTINRAARTWESVTDFGDDGVSPNLNGDRIMMAVPWGPKGVVYNALWGKQEVPFCAIELRDKTTGEITQEFDVTEFFSNIRVDDDGNEIFYGTGPGYIDINENGIWMSTHGWQMVVRVDHDGNIIWANDNGDLIGDTLSEEAAAEIGALGATRSNNVETQADITGHAAFVNGPGSRGRPLAVFGRDGTGLFELPVSQDIWPGNISGDRFTLLQEGGAYDGFYIRSARHMTNPDPAEWPGYGEGEMYGPGSALFLPYALTSGALNEDAPTAVAEVEGESLPDSYSLGSAYPNPFNPQTTIEFTLPIADGLVKVDVYNTAGQLVASLVDEELRSGVYRTTWDGRDSQGRAVSSGTYLYRMQAGDFVDTQSMTLLK